MAYRLPYWPAGRTGLWHPAFPQFGIDEGESFDDLYELFQWIDDGGLIEAHNAWFERGIWSNITGPRFGWPAIRHEQWRCSAAKAAAHALPRALGDAIDALGLSVRKDDEGAKVMKKMAKPRNPLQSERRAWGVAHAGCMACAGKGKVPGVNPDTGRKKLVPCSACGGFGYDIRAELPAMPILYHESPELLVRLFDYCRIDVLAEEALSERIPDLSADETEMYLLDQRVNERGFQLDAEAIDVALDLVDGEFAELNAELAELTGGKVLKATQRARMIAWFDEQGLELEDTQAATIDAILEGTSLHPAHQRPLTPVVKRALELVRTLGRSSTAKYEAMRNWICPDSRVHGGLLYHGASTGRWTGAGVQPHNFPRGLIKDQDTLWFLLKSRDRELILANTPTDKNGEPIYGDIMDALSQGLRGVIVPSEGKQLYVADFAGIEARVLLWLADDEAGLEIFRRGEDIYCSMASSIYGYEVVANPESQPKERALGKVAILGLGYQMGARKFVETALALGGVTIAYDSNDPNEMTAVKVVEAYREKFWRVKRLWWDTEKAAVKAVLRPGRSVPCGRVSYRFDEELDFLYCTLPSGRRLAYPSPDVIDRPTPWGDVKPSLTYMGIDQYTRQWRRQQSYGGLLVENNVQAVARDLMAAAAQRCEQSGIYQPILTVHDEMLAESAKGTGSVEHYSALMARVPVWAVGCPVEAEGWCGTRYRK